MSNSVKELPANMTAEAYKEWQNNKISGHTQTMIYFHKLMREADERIEQAKADFSEFLDLVASGRGNFEMNYEFDLEDYTQDEIDAYSNM